jgi:hypothetical protein
MFIANKCEGKSCACACHEGTWQSRGTAALIHNLSVIWSGRLHVSASFLPGKRLDTHRVGGLVGYLVGPGTETRIFIDNK